MHQQTVINTSSDRLRLVELVRKWAEVNTDGILHKTTLIFSAPHIEGIIGYRIELGTAVVYGDPVCAPMDKLALAKEFEKYCRSQNMQLTYLMASEAFASLAVEQLSFSSIEFGKKFILDPFELKSSKTALLRKKVRQSTRNGAAVHEYTGDNPKIEQSMEQVAHEWVQARKGVQIYLAGPQLFADRLGKRWFYAECEGKIIGFVLLNELQSHQGWLLNNVMVAKGSPSGVSEHLILTALEALEKEQCRFVLIGPVPARQLGKITGLGQTVSFLAGWTFKVLKKIWHLDGHEIFWDKFQPKLGSSYLLFPKKRFRLSTFMAPLRALNLSLR